MSAAARPDRELIFRVRATYSDPLAYGLVVKGDCMAPTAGDGDIVICSPAAEVSEGMLVAIHFKGERPPWIKRLTFFPPTQSADSDAVIMWPVEMDNPPAVFDVNPLAVDKIHTVVGVLRAGEYTRIGNPPLPLEHTAPLRDRRGFLLTGAAGAASDLMPSSGAP